MTPRNGRDRLKIRLALAGGLALLALAALPGLAGAQGPSRAPLAVASGLQLPAPAGAFPDSLVHLNRPLARATASARRQRSFPVLGGQQVEISSTYYGDAQMQGIANVLGGLVHGQEMDTLSVYVASPAELTEICGQDALACYAPNASEMVVSGVDGTSYGVPRDFTIAHEYGHHIANNRDNAPWAALDTGAKRWATYERVCQQVRRGRLFPGNEGGHYWDNPGEGFAESNAHLNFPLVSVPWGYNALLRPDPDSLAALYADITSPWSGPTTTTWNGRLGAAGPGVALHRFSTPLDGQLQVSLSGPAGANFDLYALGPKPGARKLRGRDKRRRRAGRKVIERSASRGSSEQLGVSVCGRSSITVAVVERSGSGPFTVGVTRP